MRRSNSLGDFGYVANIIGGFTSIGKTALDTLIISEQLDTKEKLTKEQLQHLADMAVMGQDFKDRELAAKVAISKRRDELFKKLALYVGGGLGAIILIIAVGTALLKRKGS